MNSDDYALYKATFGWLRVPYKYAGLSEKGIDCSGLGKKIFKNVYNIELSGGAGDIKQQTIPVSKVNLKTGDLIFFAIKDSNVISHMGIHLQDGFFVHASTKLGVTINNISEKYYKRYYHSAGTLLDPTNSHVVKPNK